MGISEARKAANARYLAKFERINLTVTAAQKEDLKRRADESGLSLTRYILKCCGLSLDLSSDTRSG